MAVAIDRKEEDEEEKTKAKKSVSYGSSEQETLSEIDRVSHVPSQARHMG